VPGLRAAQRTVFGEDVEQPLVHPRALGRRRESPCGLSVVAVDRVADDDARRVRMRLGLKCGEKALLQRREPELALEGSQPDDSRETALRAQASSRSRCTAAAVAAASTAAPAGESSSSGSRRSSSIRRSTSSSSASKSSPVVAQSVLLSAVRARAG
jgi:hypothetical protein